MQRKEVPRKEVKRSRSMKKWVEEKQGQYGHVHVNEKQEKQV